MAEKYNHWSDPGTGINPFVTIRKKLPSNFLVKLVRVLVGTALAIVRLPIALALLVLVALTELCAWCLLWGPLRRLCQRTFDPIFARALLWTLGFWWVREAGADLRRLRLRAAKAGKGTHDFGSVGAGDVVLCNHTSFVEVLYLAARLSPVFGEVVYRKGGGGGKAAKVRRRGLLAALWRAARGPTPASDAAPGADASVAAAAKRARSSRRAPLVLFAEGVRSNGKAVCSFRPGALPDAVLGRSDAPKIHVLAFHYTATRCSPTHPVGSWLAHAWWLCFQVWNSMHATLLPHHAAAHAGLLKAGGDGGGAVADKLRGVLAGMVGAKGVKTVAVGAEEYREFLVYWAENEGRMSEKADGMRATKWDKED